MIVLNLAFVAGCVIATLASLVFLLAYGRASWRFHRRSPVVFDLLASTFALFAISGVVAVRLLFPDLMPESWRLPVNTALALLAAVAMVHRLVYLWRRTRLSFNSGRPAGEAVIERRNQGRGRARR